MVTLDDIDNPIDHVITLEKMIDGMDSIILTSCEIKNLKFGQTIQTKKYENVDEIAIKNEDSNLVGIGTVINNYIHTKRLMNFDE